MSEKKESEVLYEEIYNLAVSQKKKTTLSNIKKACDHLEDKFKKLSPATVGNYCLNKYKTPREQSIRNNKEEFVKYIELREKERKKAITIQPTSEPIIVKDLTSQLIINQLQDEIKELKKTISNLKTGMRQISPVDIDEFISKNIQNNNIPCDLLRTDELEANLNISIEKEVDLMVLNIVKALNQNVTEKYCDIKLEYFNKKIYNSLTGIVYWEK